MADAHHLSAHRIVPDQRTHIDPQPQLLDLLEPRRQVQLRPAAVPRDHRGHAIVQEVVGARIALDVAFHMHMDVDKSRRHDALPCVNRAGGGGVMQVAHRGDASILDGDIGAEPRIAAAIDHPRVANHDVVVRRGSDERQQQDGKAHFHMSSLSV